MIPEGNDKRIRVRAHGKRRCPHCGSNKWDWLGAEPTTPEELEKFLLVRYKCLKCGKEFLVEEAKGSKLVQSVGKCIHCGSRKISKISKPDADLELWQCQQCNGFMGREPRPT